MSTAEIFTTNPRLINSKSFYPRNYDPIFLFVKELLGNFLDLQEFLVSEVKGGSTPPAYFFYPKYEPGIPFIKTSAISRHIININDLYNINEDFHRTKIKRSVTNPFDVIFSMTGKFMGKAAICPPTVEELNMSQNSVVLRTYSPLDSAFLTIFLNSKISQIQVKGSYSITKQKYINQGKISKLKILPNKVDYKIFLEDYVNALNIFYNSIDKINDIIIAFNNDFIELKDDFKDKPLSYKIKPDKLTNKILLPRNYRIDYSNTLKDIRLDINSRLNTDLIRKGNEIGSENYQFEGLPFIKTSNILNFDVDYEPDYYCSEALYNELEQDIKSGDIIFTKDGKVGEVAIIQDNANIVISSGFLKYRPIDSIDRYWIFLILSSKFGQMYFDKWTVIASTMAHLRKDFFRDLPIPLIDERLLEKYILPLKKAFEEKEKAYMALNSSKNNVLSKIYREYDITQM